MLTLIGLGLWDSTDISIKGKQAVEAADLVYYEDYTSVFGCSVPELEQFFNKAILVTSTREEHQAHLGTFFNTVIHPASRTVVENTVEKDLLEPARTKNVVLLIPGDPLCATTHIDLLQRAKEKGIQTTIIHNASIFSAIARTGLQLYKFGKITSIPFTDTPDYLPETPYITLRDNRKIEAHTLFLLDLRPSEHRFLSIPDAIRYLQRIEVRRKEKLITTETLLVGCARLGSSAEQIVVGTVEQLCKHDFGKPPYCLIIPAKMHFAEKEWLEQYQK